VLRSLSMLWSPYGSTPSGSDVRRGAARACPAVRTGSYSGRTRRSSPTRRFHVDAHARDALVAVSKRPSPSVLVNAARDRIAVAERIRNRHHAGRAMPVSGRPPPAGCDVTFTVLVSVVFCGTPTPIAVE